MESMPLTELEVITLGYAALNGITYGLWWHKPQNVGVPVYLEAKVQLSRNSPNDNSPEPESGIELSQINADVALNNNNRTTEELEQLVPQELEDTASKSSFLSRKLKDDWEHSTWVKLMFPITIPYRLIQAVIRPLVKLHQAECDYVHEGDLRVPMFFAEPVKHRYNIRFFEAIVSTIFFFVQLIPSYLVDFSYSHETTVLWWVCLTVISFGHISLVIIVDANVSMLPYLPRRVQFIPYLFVMVGIPLYMICRVALIVISILSFWYLSEAAYQTIDWISSIPHL